MLSKVSTFDDWVDLFKEWQKGIGVDIPEILQYKHEALYGELKNPEIEFGEYKGARKWRRILEVPDQRIRDALMNLIVYQGDTEFASVEQQRYLLETAPSHEDLKSLARVMVEEMRHGWQMCHILINHFGRSGKIEAQKQLERRAFENKRLLTTFNDPVRHWLDLYAYQDFVDRDGKFQLVMLSYSSFAPLASSMFPMLKEEAYHLSTGHEGLKRVLRAGKVPLRIVQKYLNKWLSSSFDLFGVDHSTSAHWFYVWGLKGRFDEPNAGDIDRDHINEHNRILYRNEAERLIAQLNRFIPKDAEPLYVPDLRFNRRIGAFAGHHFTVKGEPITEEAFKKHCWDVLPNEHDEAELSAIFKESNDWVEQKGAPKAAQGPE